jgi:hypothetical protein
MPVSSAASEAWGFITAAVAAGIALRRAGAVLSVTVLLGLAGFLITGHPPPFGPTGLALFIAAVLLLMRRDSATHSAVASVQPAST